MTTTITNEFTRYSATIRTKSLPSVSTIKRHLRKSKAIDCKSITTIEVDGQLCELIDLGNGLSIVAR
jgi:hypothetical protein